MTDYTNPVPLGDLPDGWKIKSIDSLCRSVTSGGTPLRSNPRFYRNGAIKWIKTKELKDWFIDDSEEKITEEALEESSAKLFPPNTVLMAMYGDGKTITSLGIIRNESATNQACCAMIADPDVCDYLYLFYSLKYHRSDFIQLATGGAQRNLSGTLIRNFAIMVPPLPEQRAIARILGTLDNKIELNRRMNETLEAMARAIFKSWFVEFDPVRAKVEGREPEGMDAETAALFPDSFEETELGMVPKGWRVASLGSIVDIVDCLHSRKPERQPHGKPLLQLNNIQDMGLIDMSSTYWISESDYEFWISRIEAQAGDCVITNVGRVGAVAQMPVGLKAALGRNMTALRCNRLYPFPTFLVQCLLSSAMAKEIQSKIDIGTILEALNVKNIPKLRFVLPSRKIVSPFEKICRPIRAKMEQNLLESKTLSDIRDVILPALLSGEIPVNGVVINHYGLNENKL